VKNNVILTNLFLILSACSSAQTNKPITVPAGARVETCIPFKERFRFQEFTAGRVSFKNGKNTDAKLNYNLLMREMDYIQGKDTFAISNANDIQQISIDSNIFIMNKGYMELIYNGKVKVGIKQYFMLMDIQKKDPYGQIGSGAATDSYNSLHSDGQYYKLILDQDRLFQKVSEFYLATLADGFVLFTKKKVMQLFPKEKEVIEVYLKSNKVDFSSREDLVRFAGYLNGL